MRILLIEDDIGLCQALEPIFQKNGFSVSCFSDGIDGLLAVRRQSADIIILDRMLPGLDGLSLLKTIRKEGISTPVLMLTALGESNDKVQGLIDGADDYLTKPFEVSELIARIIALSRRPAALSVPAVCLGNLTLYPSTSLLTGTNGTCNLSRRESDLLEVLLRNAGQTLTRQLLFDRIWGVESEVEEGTLDSFIHLVRRRLKTVGGNVEIRTLRGVGYTAQLLE